MRIALVLLALAAGDARVIAADTPLPLEVRYKLVKRTMQVAARERQIARMQDEIEKLREENKAEIALQKAACKGELATDAGDDLVCRTPEPNNGTVQH